VGLKMKNTSRIALLSIMLIALSMFVSLGYSVTEEPEFFSVTQDGATYLVEAIQGTTDAIDFYDYWGDSGHTPFMEDQVSKIYLYKDTSTEGKLSLIMHHSIDGSDSPLIRVDFDIDFGPDGVPSGVTTFSDDPSHNWNDRIEFDLAETPAGNWKHFYNSDGGIIIGLEGTWTITITPVFIDGINDWEYLTGENIIEQPEMPQDVIALTVSEDVAELEDEDVIVLNKSMPLVISSDINNMSPDPDVGLGFEEITGLGVVTVDKSETGPPLPNILGPYYDIQVTVSFTGGVQVEITYDDEGLSPCQERRLRLLQYTYRRGDVNFDGRVNWKDLCLIWEAMGSTPGDPNWNPNCDINNDGVVNRRDLRIARRNLFRRAFWKNITVERDPVKNIITGETDHFSIFGVR